MCGIFGLLHAVLRPLVVSSEIVLTTNGFPWEAACGVFGFLHAVLRPLVVSSEIVLTTNRFPWEAACGISCFHRATHYMGCFFCLNC